jgi:hypothetical protein
MKNNVNPCHNCTERKVGCHADCEDYLDWKYNLNEKNDNARKKKKAERILRNLGG